MAAAELQTGQMQPRNPPRHPAAGLGVVLAFAVFVYVLLGGFDLGLGVLFPLAPSHRSATP